MGEARMVNVAPKLLASRRAVARGRIIVGQSVLKQLISDKHSQVCAKGNIFSVSKVAGILGAKATSSLIPMCHQIPLDNISVEIQPCERTGSLIVTASAEATHKTGVEMESLTAVSVALLTLYDMCKSVAESMCITDIELVSKTKIEIA